MTTTTPKGRSRPRRKTAPKVPRAELSKVIASVDPVVTVVAAPAPAPAAPPPAPEPITDWEFSFLALYAEDAFCMARAAGTDLLRVRPDPRLFPRWTVLGTLTAVDAPLRIGGHKLWPQRVFYGWLLEGPGGQRVLAIRGTQRLSEWAIDGLIATRIGHPVAGKVHAGFADLYASLQIDGKPISSVAAGTPITVVGHSLGAALATLVSLKLSHAGAKVRGVFVASPRVGDAAFVKAFGAAVPDHIAYANMADIVPRVPFWFGYTHVPNVMTLSASKSRVTITGGLAAQHHVLSYATLMNRAAFRAFSPLPIDRQLLDCVRLRP